MNDQQRPRTDLRALLESVEAAPPTAAVEVVTHELAVMVGARAVSFLIADFSGHAVVRFGRAEPGVDSADSRGVRSRETVSWRTPCTNECCGRSRSTFTAWAKARG